jgi:pimeloyl-ACP methyl ester carboxylesterase
MTTAMKATGSTRDAALDRYREAERRLFERFEIEPRERFLDIAEPRVRLRILEVGPASGDPILFIPGTGGTGPYWAPLLRELSGMRCILVDRPGWGLSSPVDYKGRDYGATASDILRGTLDALGVPRADVVGASIGDLWALRLAQRAPDRIGRVALLGGGPLADLPVPRFIRLLASPVGALLVRTPSSPRMLRGQLGALGHGASLAAGRLDDFLTWRVAFDRETGSLRHERAMVQAVLGRGGWRPGFIPTESEAHAIGKPVRLVFGSADPTGSVDLWRAFIEQLPNGELQIVEGAGHMPWWDDPVKVGRLVREFLAG